MSCVSASARSLSRSVIFLILLAQATAAEAAWHCAIDQRYHCKAGDCSAIPGGATVRIDDAALTYEQCSPACESLAVTFKRSFFGSRYVRADEKVMPGLVVLRSRSGEYSEARLDATGAVTALAYGTCSWQ